MSQRHKGERQRDYYVRFKAEHGIAPTTAWRRKNADAAQEHRDRERARWQSDPVTRAKHYEHARIERQRLKQEVFEHYGGARCQCCGETEAAFLSLDHVNNDGADQRRVLGHHGSGVAFYRLPRNTGYPEGYQVLCMNCNFGKRMNGGVCPHQQRRAEDWQ